MATRMQQRRGTAAQWISTNAGAGPVLNAGEIGWESDTNKFKIGDGVNNWTTLDYFADINSIVNPSFGTSITFEGATADSFETTISVTDPTADRTITIPDVTGTVITTGNLSDITNVGVLTSTVVMEGTTADSFELTLSSGDPTADRTITFPDSTGTVALTNNKLNAFAATTSAELLSIISDETGTGSLVFASSPSIAAPALTGDATAVNLTVSGNLTVNGTTTNINSTNLVIEDKNIILGDVTTPSDITADGGGITLKGSTDKTFNWVDSTDSWTSSEHITLNATKELRLSDTNSSHYVGFKASTEVNANVIWTLPAADGSNEYVLTTNGSGVLSWQPSGAGGGGASFSEFMLIGA
jgi:hypothetical protein